MTARIALTYRDYAALPDNGQRYEIHDGELSLTPAPSLDHQIVLARLFSILYRHVEAQSLGLLLFAPVDVILADTTILQPDLVFLAHERRSAASRRGIEGAPTLAVEAISPSTAVTDRGVKRQLYAHHGVPYVWLVDIEARIVEAYVLRVGEYVEAGRGAGPDPVDLPPFTGLGLVPDMLWPPRPR
jgi:Uma2 family endonuclease